MTNTDQSLIRHQSSSGIDTFRDGSSLREVRHVPQTAVSADESHLTGPNARASGSVIDQYRAAMTSSIISVIKTIEINRPRLSDPKRDLLLFFAQGHHLALGGDPLFTEAIYATDHGIAVDYQADPSEPESPPTGALNTINRMLTRYADLSPADLRTLIRTSVPWQLAMKSTVGPRIEGAWLRDWFTRPEEVDDPTDGRPTRTQMAAWATRHSR
ncbi:hypothetical protein [Actinoplanes couchii]|nr:hypothetical protein [Actinoplanes couchii]MDR6319460.1 putative phage-associated protein [Actinoplanes couchii]